MSSEEVAIRQIDEGSKQEIATGPPAAEVSRFDRRTFINLKQRKFSNCL